MRGAGGFLAVAVAHLCVATLLVCCSADPHQDSDVNEGEHTGEPFETSGQNHQNLDSIGDKNRVRDVRDTGHMLLPYLLARQHYYRSDGGNREPFPHFTAKYGNADGPNGNFDEIDLSGLNTFVSKRNMDEIDQTSMPFPYATKRFYHLYGPNHSPLSSFDKKRYRADYPMDEIDLSHFPIGSKRSQGLWSLR